VWAQTVYDSDEDYYRERAFFVESFEPLVQKCKELNRGPLRCAHEPCAPAVTAAAQRRRPRGHTTPPPTTIAD
jgi:hypothetical protein